MDDLERIEALEALFAPRQLASMLVDMQNAGDKLYKAYDSLMPGLQYIAVQDYMLINDAPVAWSHARIRDADLEDWEDAR